MSTPEIARVVCGLPVPVRSAPAIAVMVVIGIAIVVASIVVVPSPDDEICTTALVDPHPIAMPAPRLVFNTWLPAILPHHSKIVRVPVSRNLTFLILPVGRAVESLCVRSRTGEKQHNRH